MTGTLPKQHKAARIIERIVLAIALIWTGGCTFIWTQIDMPHRIMTAKSVDGTCEVVINKIGSPIFFSPSSITIKVSWDTNPSVVGAENVTEVKTNLHNDGKSLSSGNFTVTWHGNILTVTTHGEEQSDQGYTFNWK